MRERECVCERERERPVVIRTPNPVGPYSIPTPRDLWSCVPVAAQATGYAVPGYAGVT